jgi:hypothetical protein
MMAVLLVARLEGPLEDSGTSLSVSVGTMMMTVIAWVKVESRGELF